jgi:hypothetical protein
MRHLVLDHEDLQNLVSDLVAVAIHPIEDGKVNLARVAVVTIALTRAGFAQAEIQEFVGQAIAEPIDLSDTGWLRDVINRAHRDTIKP